MESTVNIQDIGIYSREDKYLYAIATGDLSVLPTRDITRKEMYYKHIAVNSNLIGTTIATVESNNRFTSIPHTARGLISDVVIEGKTVNGISVGTDVDELYIEAVSENLFDENTFTKYIISSDDESITLDYFAMNKEGYQFDVPGNGVYTFKYICKETVGGKNPRFSFYYSDGTTANINSTTTNSYVEYKRTSDPNKQLVGIRVGFSSSLGTWQVKKNSIMLYSGATTKEYTPRQAIKRPIVYYNPNTQVWEKPILNEGEYITRRFDGNYYYHNSEGIFECNNLSLVSFEGETNLIVSTGTVSPKVTVKVRQHLSNVVDTLQNRLSELECTIARLNEGNNE